MADWNPTALAARSTEGTPRPQLRLPCDFVQFLPLPVGVRLVRFRDGRGIEVDGGHSGVRSAALEALGGWTGLAWLQRWPSRFDDSSVADMGRQLGHFFYGLHVNERTAPEHVVEDFAGRGPSAPMLLRLAAASGPGEFFAARPGCWWSPPEPPILAIVQPNPAKVTDFNWDAFRRAARRDLLHACVIRETMNSLCVMVWRAPDADTTKALLALKPTVPIRHLWPETEVPPPPPPGGGRRRKGASARAGDAADTDVARLRRQLAAAQRERDALLAEVAALRANLAEAREPGWSERRALEALGLDASALKGLIKLVHPDRHGNSPESNEAVIPLLSWLKIVDRGR